MIQPEDLEAVGDLVRQVTQESDSGEFEHLDRIRSELKALAKAVTVAVSFVESEMLRQVEKTPKVIGDRTFVNGKDYSYSYNHELILDRAWRKAMRDSTNAEDGHVDWVHLGEAMREIFTQLYLAPSTKAKKGGLDFIEVRVDDVETKSVKGRKLIIHGDET